MAQKIDTDPIVEYTNILGSQHLAKACCDEFDYAMKLRTGEVIRFESAKIVSKEFIHLNNIALLNEHPREFRLPCLPERGIDVRISAIEWVMDAPEGS